MQLLLLTLFLAQITWNPYIDSRLNAVRSNTPTCRSCRHVLTTKWSQFAHPSMPCATLHADSNSSATAD